MAGPQSKEQWLLVLDAIQKIQDCGRNGDWDELRRMVDSAGVSAVGAGAASRVVVDGPLSKSCYLFSEPSGSGYRVVLGFATQEAAMAAHTFLARERAAAQQANAPTETLSD